MTSGPRDSTPAALSRSVRPERCNRCGCFLSLSTGRPNFGRLVAEYEEGDDEIPEPQMEWIEALAKSANTQESFPVFDNLALPPLLVGLSSG